MIQATWGLQEWLAQWANKPYVYLTTIGRQTGEPYRIEIWFAVEDGRVYLLSGDREMSEWVRNLRANAQVTIELGVKPFVGTARILDTATAEDQRARELLVAKYATLTNTLANWKQSALAVVVEFPVDAAGAHAPQSRHARSCQSQEEVLPWTPAASPMLGANLFGESPTAADRCMTSNQVRMANPTPPPAWCHHCDLGR